MSLHSAPENCRKITAFQGLSSIELAALMPSLRPLQISGGETIFSPDHRNPDVYFLLDGAVKVFLEMARGHRILNFCSDGAVLGEISAMYGNEHTACVGTVRDCRFLVMTGPTQVEGVNAQVALSTDTVNAQVWALDVTGARRVQIASTVQGGVLRFWTLPRWQTLWYEIVRE